MDKFTEEQQAAFERLRDARAERPAERALLADVHNVKLQAAWIVESSHIDAVMRTFEAAMGWK